MRFDLGGTPVPGLFIKMLHRDEKTGFYTRLIKAKPGWGEHPLAHHPCYEEAYCLEGGFEYNWGTMWPGTYFFRPAARSATATSPPARGGRVHLDPALRRRPRRLVHRERAGSRCRATPSTGARTCPTRSPPSS